MKLTELEERWAVWTVQARNFAKRENFADAVARMKVVRGAIEQALSNATDPRDQRRLEAHLARADELLEEFQASYDAWRSKIAARRQQTIDSAAEEMARPLPNPAGSR